MEGKAVLFKRFADIDAFDIEIDYEDPEKFIDCVAGFGDSFGGINLEDIKSPECFEIEAKLRERLEIPVFHDDQHVGWSQIYRKKDLHRKLGAVGKRLLHERGRSGCPVAGTCPTDALGG